MSDLNELIHTNATIAFNQGAQREQERIVKLLEDWQQDLLKVEPVTDEEMIEARDNRYKNSFDYLFALIKGEGK
jgi:hypothetical protein